MKEIGLPHEREDRKPRRTILTEKRWLLFVYLPVFVLAGFLLAILIQPKNGMGQAIDLVFGIGLNIFAFAWCRSDARERGYALHRLFPYGVVIFGSLAFIYYLFRSRGFQGGLRSFAWFVLYTVGLFAAVTIIAVIVVILLVLIHVLPTDPFPAERKPSPRQRVGLIYRYRTLQGYPGIGF